MKSAAGWSSYQQIPPISDDSGLVHVSAKDRAEVLNAAFACDRQCSAPSAAHPPRLSTSSSFAFQPITEESTFKALRGVPIRKASGLDDLPARLLFECAAEIAAPLCSLSLSSGLFPSQWKIACIQPVFKNKGVTGTLKHVKSSVARTGGIVLRWSSGYGAGG